MYMCASKLPQEQGWQRIRREGKCAILVCLKQNSIIPLSDDHYPPSTTVGELNTQMTDRTRTISIASSATWLSCSAGFTPHEPFCLWFYLYVIYLFIYLFFLASVLSVLQLPPAFGSHDAFKLVAVLSVSGLPPRRDGLWEQYGKSTEYDLLAGFVGVQPHRHGWIG